MIIPARPNLNISALLSRAKPSNHLEVEFYMLGREALLSALIHLGLKKGDGVIVPAYMCSSTLEPLEAYGLEIVFIDVDQQLRLPMDQLRVLICDNQVKALLAVHYFGFTQKIDEILSLCCQHGVKVIEDASHSFLSQSLSRTSKRRADAEIFSMRKSLPVHDGGALRLNSKNTTRCIDKQCLSWVSDIKNILIRLAERVLIKLDLNIYADAITKLKNNTRRFSNSGKMNTEVSPCLPSWSLKKYLSNESYLKETRQRITRNFTQLADALTAMGFKLAINDIEYNVPQACVIYDNKGGLVDYLREQGVGAWRWPAEEMPEVVASQAEKYPNANHYNKTLVLLPIHQSVSAQQINHMIQVLSKWQS